MPQTQQLARAVEEALKKDERTAGLEHLQICGLMAMAGREGDRGSARADFARLRVLRDQLQRNCPTSVSLHELSMGMSGDFDVAIEEGATMVRVGSALLEGVTL